MDLPPELIDQILYYVSNKDYLLCYGTDECFRVSSKKVFRKRMYCGTDFYRLLYDGDLDGVRYHLDNDSDMCSDQRIDERLYGHIKYIAEKEELVAFIAAYKGHRHILNELIRRGITLPRKVAVFAIRGGQLDILKYLHYIGFRGAGIVYHLKHYMFEKGIKWHNTVFDKLEKINMCEFYDFSEGNRMGMDIKGEVYQW